MNHHDEEVYYLTHDEYGNKIKSNAKKKLTHEEYERRLEERYHGEYTVLEPYVNMQTKILHRHNCEKCNYNEWKIMPSSILNKNAPNGCPICGKEKNMVSQRKTYAQFEKEFFEVWSKDEYEILSKEYKSNSTKMKFKHLVCGAEFENTPYKILHCKYPCKCLDRSATRRTTIVSEEEYVENLPENLELIGPFKGLETKTLHKCHKCGKEIMMKPGSVRKGRNCINCRNIKATLRNNKENTTFYKKLRGKYEMVTEFVSSNKPITLRHITCGHEFETTPHMFRSCPECAPNTKISPEKFRKFFNENSNNGEYELISEYESRHKDIAILHKKCGNEYKTMADNFITGHRCPICNESLGERMITKYLNEEGNFSYEKQFSFDDCKYKRKLKFDFKIDGNNGEIILIEFDGEQHFREIKTFKGNLEQTKIRDKIKGEYCAKHNIPLYRISYDEYENIYNILDEIFAKHKLL